MPQFNPSEEKVALATFPVAPAGLACAAELWLASNGTKVATSGEIPFTSTGLDQAISLPITMPGAEGTYPVYLDVFSGGVFIKGFRAVEDVVIGPAKLLINGSFEDGWTGWAWWTNYPGRFGCSIDDRDAYEGLYSARFYGSVAGRAVVATLSQVVPWRDDYRGKTFNLSVMKKVLILGSAHDINGNLALIIDDGVGISESEVYFSEAAWIKQEVIRAISPNATKLEVIFRITPNRNWSGSGFHIDKAGLEEL